MSVIYVELHQGGFGNACFKYAYARKLAESTGRRLVTTSWIGQKIFKLDPNEEGQIDPDVSPIADLAEAPKGESVRIGGFCQHGRHLIYSKQDALRYFKFQPWVLEMATAIPRYEVAAHVRWGDFVGHNGFIAITMSSYDRAAEQFGIDPKKIRFICVDNPIEVPSAAPKDCPTWLPDFMALCQADILFRGPSTFSWWAGALGEHSRIFSPDQNGRPWQGGHRGFQDVPFVEGNHMPITSWWEGHSELHLRES